MTGLRGIAALSVVCGHYSGWCAPWPSGTAPAWFTALFALDGMTIFFMLSGFVIAYNYVDMDWRGAPAASLRRFAWLRFTRLYPGLLAFFLLVLLFRHPVKIHGWWMLVDLLSIQTWTPAFAPAVNGPLMLAWSISTEIGMYLMFAGFMMLAPRARVAAAAVYGAAILWAALTIEDGTLRQWFFYLSPYWRFTEFAIGAAAAVFILRCRMNAEENPGLVHRFLRTRPLMFAGTISYSLYLLHDVGASTAARMLGLRIFGHVTSDAFSPADLPAFALNMSAGLVLAIALAYAGYRLVERPAQRALRQWRLPAMARTATQPAA